MRILRALVVAAVVAVAGAACAAPPATTDPQLAAVVADVWPAGSAPRAATVTWQIGMPPAGYAAWTTWTCVGTACVFTVTVDPGYVTPHVVAHEGGHVVCVSSWGDRSEGCAETVGLQVLG